MRGAVEDWQAKHSGPEMPLRLTTGFLDGTSPVVDIYELKVTTIKAYSHFIMQSLIWPPASSCAYIVSCSCNLPSFPIKILSSEKLLQEVRFADDGWIRVSVFVRR